MDPISVTSNCCLRLLRAESECGFVSDMRICSLELARHWVMSYTWKDDLVLGLV